MIFIERSLRLLYYNTTPFLLCCCFILRAKSVTSLHLLSRRFRIMSITSDSFTTSTYRKLPPLYTPSPFLLIFTKEGRSELLLVEVLQTYTSTDSKGISTHGCSTCTSRINRQDWWRLLSVMEVLYTSNNNTSTDFMLILSTNLLLVEVVEIVEVLAIIL